MIIRENVIFLEIPVNLSEKKCRSYSIAKKGRKMVLHLIEMKSKIDNKKWREIKQKIRASYFNICALERVLGIHIEKVKTYTTYENIDFWEIKRNPDLKGFAIPLGKRHCQNRKMNGIKM